MDKLVDSDICQKNDNEVFFRGDLQLVLIPPS